MKDLDIRRVKVILLVQVVVTLISAVVALFFGALAGISALLGGLITTLSNLLFAFWVFGRYRAQDPGKLVYRMYGAELLKLLSIVLMFAAVFAWVKPLNIVALFGAFLVVQILPPLVAHRFSG
jgi:ATP synthase protein I